jgi:hypothetical protein
MMSDKEHTGAPDCPACEEDLQDVDEALTLLEECVDDMMPNREEIRYRLTALLAQVEGIIAPPSFEFDENEVPPPRRPKTAAN